MGSLARTYKRSRIPLYLQVASTLRKRIEDGLWVAGQKISTLEELEEEFQVARVTVRQAIDVLQKDGMVIRQQGKGTFVTQGPKNRRWLRLETDWASLIATIQENVPRIIPVRAPVPPPRLGSDDGQAAAQYHYIRSVQTRNNEPYALAGVHLAKNVYERAPKAFQSKPALAVISEMKDIEISRAHQTLVIGSADMDTADSLKVALNSPTAEAHCVVMDGDGVAIYVAEIIYRGDCIKLDIDLLDSGYSAS